MNHSPESLQAAIQGAEAWVRVVGPGSFRISPAMKTFATSAVECGCLRLVFEMALCTGMDSTFMGVLAGLALRMKKQNGQVVLAGLNERNARSLKTLGIGPLVQMLPAAPENGPDAAAWTALDTPKDRRRAAETMLAAHETLAAASPENSAKFKDVLACLKADLNGEGGGEKAGQG